MKRLLVLSAVVTAGHGFANSDGAIPVEAGAAAVVACAEAGGNTLEPTFFDEEGLCPALGNSIWLAPSTNPTITVTTIEGWGAAGHLVTYQPEASEQSCGFYGNFDLTSEDALIDVTQVYCSAPYTLADEISLTIGEIFCGEFDPYTIGDACLVETVDANGQRINLLTEDQDLNAYELLEGLEGQSISFTAASLKQIQGALELDILYGAPSSAVTTLSWDGSFVTPEAPAVDCYEYFTAGFTQDSQSFQIREFDLINQDDIGIELATSAVWQLVSEAECTLDQELVIDSRNSECREIIPGLASSEACYVETNLGYFFTTQDSLGHMNLTFNRWD
ncbi:MAG: hypothetical protein HRU19_02565 [Pseudobacteriovorax sp.]|nr:hypothetical protein [Pseudobacteriovorax sp.]